MKRCVVMPIEGGYLVGELDINAPQDILKFNKTGNESISEFTQVSLSPVSVIINPRSKMDNFYIGLHDGPNLHWSFVSKGIEQRVTAEQTFVIFDYTDGGGAFTRGRTVLVYGENDTALNGHCYLRGDYRQFNKRGMSNIIRVKGEVVV